MDALKGNGMSIATIGYEKVSIEDFVTTLLRSNIRVLIDVRQLPLSRKKGFSKRALESALANVGINYIHLRGLGDPKDGREAARAGNFGQFLKIFSSHMKTPEFKTAIERAISILNKDGGCLMCYERDPEQCHRKLVAEVISAIMRKNIVHLGVQNESSTRWHQSRTRESTDSRKGASSGR